MTAEQGRMVLFFAEQVQRILAPCLEPLWRCVTNGPADKGGYCGGFLHKIGAIDGLDLPIPDDVRPIFGVFANLLNAGWAPKDAIETVRTEKSGPQTPGLRTLEHRNKLPEGDPTEEPKHTIAIYDEDNRTDLQDFNQDTTVETGGEARDHLQGGAGDDLTSDATEPTGNEPENDADGPSVFDLNRQQAQDDLDPETLPRDDLAKSENENWDDWSVRLIEDLSDSSKEPEEIKETIRRFYGELNRPENADVLAAAMQGVSQEAYLNPQGDPVSGPDLEDLQQWLADNPGKTPSDSPLAQSHSSYLAKDGNFYRTTSETSKHIGRHARLLQGEIKAFENRANVKTGKYLDVLLAASGGGIGGKLGTNRHSPKNHSGSSKGLDIESDAKNLPREGSGSLQLPKKSEVKNPLAVEEYRKLPESGRIDPFRIRTL